MPREERGISLRFEKELQCTIEPYAQLTRHVHSFYSLPTACPFQLFCLRLTRYHNVPSYGH